MHNYDVLELKSVLKQEKYDELNKFLNIKCISNALDVGAFIAGGFARALLSDTTLTNYISPDKQQVEHYRPGDIDVFFKTPEDAKKYVESLDKLAHVSLGGFAKDVNLYTKNYERLIPIQFVDHPMLCNGTIENALDCFDFMNCGVAFNRDMIWIPKNWIALEESKLLKINHSNSPFLGSRLLKYLKYKGFIGITEDSQQKFTDWLIKAANSDFDHALYDNAKHTAGLHAAIKNLNAKELLTKEELLFFIGKWKESQFIKENATYGATITKEVDWAVHSIANYDATHTSA